MVGITLVFSRSGGPAPTLVEATPLGWWYTTTVPGDRMVAVLMTDGDLCAQHRLGQPRTWQSALAAAPLTRERLGAEHLLSGPRVHAAATHTLGPPSGEGWLAVGDAAAGRDPISGSGVDFALASAELAAVAIESRRQGDHRALGTYGELVRRDFASYRAERLGYYAAEQRWPDSVFWLRRREKITASEPGPARTMPAP
jgi:flavin-dependent dehydrogenase